MMNCRIRSIAEQHGLKFSLRYGVCGTEEAFERVANALILECSRVAKLAVHDNKVCDAIETHFEIG